MTGLRKLNQTIKELQKGKRELLSRIQESTWKDSRTWKKMPASRGPVDDLGLYLVLEDMKNQQRPERRALPGDLGLAYQRWYSTGLGVLEKYQPRRVREFEAMYLGSGKNAPGGIKQLLEQRYVTEAGAYRLIDLLRLQGDVLEAIPSFVEATGPSG